MKKFLIIIATFISAIAVAQYNPEAKKYLDAVAETVKNGEGLSIDFNIKVSHIQDSELLSNVDGVLLIKDNNYKLSVNGTDTYSDGVDQWIHMLEEQEVTIQPLEEWELTPASIFTIYQQGYRFRILNEDNDNVVVELSPEAHDSSEYIRITLYINKKENKIDAFAAQSKSGHISNIEIKSWQNKSLDNSVLTYNAETLPDVEVIDLR